MKSGHPGNFCNVHYHCDSQRSLENIRS